MKLDPAIYRKSIGWAYPSSSRATTAHLGSTGCWVVEVESHRDRKLVGLYAKLEDAAKAAIAVEVPWSAPFLRFMTDNVRKAIGGAL